MWLGDGFKYVFYVSPLFGEDEPMLTNTLLQGVGSTTNQELPGPAPSKWPIDWFSKGSPEISSERIMDPKEGHDLEEPTMTWICVAKKVISFWNKILARWWFQILVMFIPTWGRFPIWLIFFRWVGSTTKQLAWYSSSAWGSLFFSDKYLISFRPPQANLRQLNLDNSLASLASCIRSLTFLGCLAGSNSMPCRGKTLQLAFPSVCLGQKLSLISWAPINKLGVISYNSLWSRVKNIVV